MVGPGWEWLLVCYLFQGALNGTGGRRLYTVDTLRFAARAFFLQHSERFLSCDF